MDGGAEQRWRETKEKEDRQPADPAGHHHLFTRASHPLGNFAYFRYCPSLPTADNKAKPKVKG